MIIFTIDLNRLSESSGGSSSQEMRIWLKSGDCLSQIIFRADVRNFLNSSFAIKELFFV